MTEFSLRKGGADQPPSDNCKAKSTAVTERENPSMAEVPRLGGQGDCSPHRCRGQLGSAH